MSIFIAFIGLLLITLLFYFILTKEEKQRNDFYHILAHRFRSPISIVKWYVELISDKSVGNLNDKQKIYLTEIYNASENLNKNIESFTILLQLQSNKLIAKTEKVNIKELITKIALELKSKIERHKIRLETILPKQEQIIIKTDLKLLKLALQSLIENSIRYTPENGYINIKTEIIEDKLLIAIKDNGCGISKRKGSRILANSVSYKDIKFNLDLVNLILKKLEARTSRCSREKETTFSIYLSI